MKQIKDIYEENASPLLSEYKIDKNIFIYLILKFDKDAIFYPKLNEEIYEETENEKENVNKIYTESFKENDLSTPKTNSEKKKAF